LIDRRALRPREETSKTLRAEVADNHLVGSGKPNIMKLRQLIKQSSLGFSPRRRNSEPVKLGVAVPRTRGSA